MGRVEAGRFRVGFASLLRVLIVLFVPLVLGASSAVQADQLCILPMQMPFDEDDPRYEKVEGAVSERFEAAGFGVRRSAEVGPLLERVDEAYGEIYDPLDGRILLDAYARFKEESTRALGGELGCRAQLLVSLVVVQAPFSNGVASWDGVRRQMASTGLLALQVLGGVSEYGWVKATSIRFELRDLAGEPVGFRSAGIEPLVRQTVTKGTDQLPIDQWLVDDVRFRKALDVSLGSGAAKMRSNGTAAGGIDTAAVGWP